MGSSLWAERQDGRLSIDPRITIVADYLLGVFDSHHDDVCVANAFGRLRYLDSVSAD